MVDIYSILSEGMDADVVVALFTCTKQVFKDAKLGVDMDVEVVLFMCENFKFIPADVD